MECVQCVCLWLRGGVGDVGCEWLRGFGLGFTNTVGTGGVCDVCLGCLVQGLCAWCYVFIICVSADICTSWVHPVFNPVVPYRYLLSTVNPYFLGYCGRTWISLHIARFYEEQCHVRLAQKNRQEGVDTICTADCQTTVTAPPHVDCVSWSRCIVLVSSIRYS